jgi:hypothetical protein
MNTITELKEIKESKANPLTGHRGPGVSETLRMSYFKGDQFKDADKDEP